MARRVVAAVEDLLFRSKISETANTLGVEALFPRSREKLIERIYESPPDLLVLDLNSARFKPLKLLEQLKSDEVSRGVPVVGFRTRRFPGFYLADSGSTLDWDVKYEEEAVQLIASLRSIGPEGSGLIVANPVPWEEQLDPKLHDRVLKEGLGELKHQGIRGKSVTPFLLERLQRETKGESLRVNKHIVRNNARLATRIVVAFATLEAREGNRATKL